MDRIRPRLASRFIVGPPLSRSLGHVQQRCITLHQSPQDLEVVVTPLDKTALTYREFREYVAEEEDSRYEVYLRYNRTA